MANDGISVPFWESRFSQQSIFDFHAVMNSVLASRRYVLGPCVEKFEREWANAIGVRSCVGVASGTDAIELALRALGIKSDEEVYVPSLTAIPTVSAVVSAGGRPVFVDVDPVTLTMDPIDLSSKIGGCKTTPFAVVPVHLYGQVCDMDGIRNSAGSDLKIVEDCAHAHGAMWFPTGVRAGAIGDVGCFSFYPTKIVGAFGDAGAVTTDLMHVASALRSLRQYGWDGPERIAKLDGGRNSRLDEIQAALLSASLSSRVLNARVWERSQRARQYSAFLSGLEGVTLPESKFDHVWHLYVVRVKNRAQVRRKMRAIGIETAVHYDPPVHLHPAFVKYASASLPVTELAASEVLSLPLFDGITETEVDCVCRALKESL